MSFRWPLDNVDISQGFGGNFEDNYYAQFGQKGHNGIDLAADAGTPVYAADEGTVKFEGYGKSGASGFPGWFGDPAGICILIDHIGSYAGYAHLSRTVVNSGDKVTKGQLIGYVGATGAAEGSHLHFEMIPYNPNFSNGYAGRINPMPFIEATKNATEAEVRQAYRDILEREVDPGGLNHYKGFPLDAVRQSLMNCPEKRELDARKANEARAAAEKAAAEAAKRIEEAKKAAEAKAAQDAAKKAEDARLAAEAELVRIAEEERIAREAAEAKAQSLRDIQDNAEKEGDMTTTPETKEPVQPTYEVKTPGEANKSASLFLARVGSQVLTARVLAEGIAGIITQQIGYVFAAELIGWITIVLAAFIIWWAQWGYQVAQNANWKWAANLKWPF